MDASSLFYKQLGRLKNGITEFFHNLSIDCSCLNKKYARKKLGVTVLVFEICETKGNFEGKLLRLCCHSNFLSGTKNNGIQK